MLLRRGRLTEAEATLRRALALLERTQTAPTALRASVLEHLADVERARGRDGEARRLLAESAAIYRAIGGAEDARARGLEARLASPR